jgi:hypothetical protein
MATRWYEQNGARGQLSYTILPPLHRNQIRDELEGMERPSKPSKVPKQQRRKEGIQSPSISTPRAGRPRKGEQDEDEDEDEGGPGWMTTSSPENSPDSRRGGALTADQRSAAACVIDPRRL